MAFTGDLEGMSPTDLLQLVAMGNKSGILTMVRNEETRNLFISNGRIVGVNSSRSKDRLGAILLRMNLISSKQLSDLRDEQARKTTQMGRLLVEKRWISESTLERVLQKQLHEIVFEILTWDSGTFSFAERTLTESENLVNPATISSLLLEGARRIDEWRRIRQMIPHDQIVIRKLLDDQITISGWTHLDVNIWMKLSKPCTIVELFQSINESEFNILYVIRSFLEKDLVCKDEELEKQLAESTQKLRVMTAHAINLEKQKGYHEASNVVVQILELDPDNEDARKMQARLEERTLKEARRIVQTETSIPVIRKSFSSLSPDNFTLSHQEGFVFSRIDGNTDIRSLKYLTNLPIDDLYIILHKLSQMGLISFQKKRIKTRFR